MQSVTHCITSLQCILICIILCNGIKIITMQWLICEYHTINFRDRYTAATWKLYSFMQRILKCTYTTECTNVTKIWRKLWLLHYRNNATWLYINLLSPGESGNGNRSYNSLLQQTTSLIWPSPGVSTIRVDLQSLPQLSMPKWREH